jgi:hypothetical protein
MKNNRQIRLKELLVKVCEGKCERLPNENDEDFITRCGNAAFDQKYLDAYKQRVGSFKKPNFIQ